MERPASVIHPGALTGGRRAILTAGALLLPGRRAGAQRVEADPPNPWFLFRQRFLATEGRVMESGQAGRTLSRHQALALQFAVRANDRPTFERMLHWTVAQMAMPGRGQLVQRWESGEAMPVNDVASDTLANLYFAWALLLAAQAWGEAPFAALARRFADAIERTSLLRIGGRYLLLPASYGYFNEQRAVISPAVHFLPALRALSLHTRNPVWQRVSEDGLQLLPHASFSQWSLPADWVELAPDGSVAGLAQDFLPRFGRQAAHVPLYLLWAGETENSCIPNVRDAWNHRAGARPPEWISLPDGQVSEQPGGAGIEALAGLIAAPGSGLGDAARLVRQAQDPWSCLTVLAAEHVGASLAQGPSLL